MTFFSRSFSFYSTPFKVGAVLGTLLFLTAAYHFSSTPEDSPPAPVLSLEGADIKSEQVAWSSYLQKVGPDRAYEAFKEVYEGSSYPLRHAMMHMMGDVLYENIGVDGFSVCDDAFGYGCYHQLYIAAFANEGTSILNMLAKLCMTKEGASRGFCTHGIGHGAVEAYGNNESALVRALGVCTSIEKTMQNSIGQCLDGAFMQYQNPREAEETRPIDQAVPSRLCDSVVSEEFQFHCYLSLARWWLGASNNDYDLASRLCSGVPGSFQPPCYRGIGVEAFILNGFDPDGKTEVGETLEMCGRINEEIGRSYCRVGAAAVARLFTLEERVVERLCEGLSGKELAECTR